MALISRMRMHLDISRILLAIYLLMTFACTRQEVNNANQINIGYMAIAECLPLFVAHHNGYFDSLDVGINLIQFPGGAQILEAMAAGSVDAGISNLVSLVFARQGGLDFLAFWGSTIEDSDHILHGLIIRDSTITTASDLDGKTIGINTLRNIDELLVTKWLEDRGLSRSKVSLLEIPFPRMPEVLVNGDVDAIAVVEPFLSISQLPRYGGKVLGSYFLRQEGSTAITSYCATSGWLNSNPELVRKFITGMNQAINFILSNENDSRQILTRYTKLSPELARSISLPEFSKSIPELMHLEYLVNEMSEADWLRSPMQVEDLIYAKRN